MMMTGAGAQELKSAQIAHPAMPASSGSAEGARAAVDPVLDRGMEFILDMVPERNGIRFCECPNCDMGTQAGQIAWNGIDHPERVHCRHCGHVYPSEQYPMNKVIQLKNRRGKDVEWRYYELPDGDRCFFDARGRYERKSWAARFVLQLADAWVATGDEKYADAGAELLYDISQKYAGWCFVNDDVSKPDGPVPDAEPPYMYWGGIWSRWFYADAPMTVADAYDRLYDSGAFERLGQRKGLDVQAAIENDMLHASIEFLRSYKEYYSNMSPHIYESLIVYGRILNEPDYVHDGVQRAVDLLRNQFFFDGIWMEGTISYHHQTTGLLQRVFNVAKGYSDPAGYTWPQSGQRFDDLDMQRDLPFVGKAIDSVRALTFPNGRIVAVHDAWATSSSKTTETNSPVLLSGMRHARLARGEDSTAMQAHLHFSGGHGHQHADNLGLILWAKGRELLSDIGYTHTAWRTWSTRTPAHNTVTINQASQSTRGVGGNVTLYAPISDDLQVVEAQSLVAYPDVATEYRRRVAVIGVSTADAYVLDIFRVAGGTRHDWALHGSADYPQTVTLSLPTEPMAGNLIGPDAEFEYPQSESKPGKFPPGIDPAYAFPKDVEAAQTEEAWSATFEFAEGPAPHVKVDVLGQPGVQVCTMMSPSIRNAKENDADLPKHFMPSVMVRRVSEADPLSSTFVAVHQPYTDTPFIRSVTPLLPAPDAAGPVGLRVEHDGGVDYIVCSPAAGGQTVSLSVDGQSFEFTGRFGLVRLVGGVPVKACLIGGTRLSYAGIALEAPSAGFSAPIAEVLRDDAADTHAFVIEGDVPAHGAMAGAWAVVTHGDGTTNAYEIAGVAEQDGRVILRLAEDPGFALDAEGNTQWLYYHPEPTISGRPSISVETVACVETVG